MLTEDQTEPTFGSRQNLTGIQRFLLLVFALLFGGLGVGAIFLTDNEAGSAVALLICGVLVLVAVQGTKVQRISAGENSVDFVAQIRANVARQAEETAREDPEAAEALIDNYAAADPMARTDPTFDKAKGVIYELVAMAIVDVAIREQNLDVRPAAGGGAFVVGDKLLAVEVKYRQPNRKLYLRDARLIKAQLETTKADAVLVISNVPPTADALDYLQGSAIHIAVWLPEEQNADSIRSKLAQVLTTF